MIHGHPFRKPGEGGLNIKMSSSRYKDPNVKDKTFARPTHL